MGLLPFLGVDIFTLKGKGRKVIRQRGTAGASLSSPQTPENFKKG
jgi:hypothetical protein